MLSERLGVFYCLSWPLFALHEYNIEPSLYDQDSGSPLALREKNEGLTHAYTTVQDAIGTSVVEPRSLRCERDVSLLQGLKIG